MMLACMLPLLQHLLHVLAGLALVKTIVWGGALVLA
jgi:hypothetical protein